MDALVIFAKYPEPGKVKKKIGRELGMDVSAQMCEAFVRDLMKEHFERDYDLYLSFVGSEYKQKYKKMFPGAILYVQRGKNFSENIYCTFEDLLDDYDKVVVIGCAVPDLKSADALKAFNALNKHDVVIGPTDGKGYYLIGMKEAYQVFDGFRWNDPDLLKKQLKELKKKNLSHALLEKRHEVDTVDDLKHLKTDLKKEDAETTWDFVEKLGV